VTLLKATVLALILANMGYFLWARDLAAADSVPAARGGAVSPSIKLASETAQSSSARNAADALHDDSTDGGNSKAGETAGDDPSSQLLNNLKRCISIGPFRDVSEAVRAATTLRASGYGPRQRVADGEVWAGVWVYLPRPDDVVASDQLMTKLKKAGIDDAMEMPGPNDASVVSLGLFSEPKRAQARVAQAQGLGFKPLIVDRKRNGNVFWVDIDLKSTDGLLNPADLQGEAGRIVRLEVKACPARSTP
jgi:hypothetical protein